MYDQLQSGSGGCQVFTKYLIKQQDQTFRNWLNGSSIS